MSDVKSANNNPAARKRTTSTKPPAPANETAVVKKAKPAAPAPAKPTAKKPATAQPAATTESTAAKPKHKLVRDSFTIPKAEYAVLDALKVRAAKLARPVKKSELLRAGINALNGMSDKAFLVAMNSVPSLKTGRPSQAARPEAARTK